MPASAEETAALLGRVPVFEELADDDLRRVAEVTVPRRFGAGEVVFREGDDSDTCYVVNAGHARAIREHPDGRQITLATFGPGDIFGELAMFDDERRSATVEATDELEVLGILGGDMRRLLRRHPDMAVKLVISLGRRLRAANERLARQSFQTVQSRVAAVLAQLVEQAQARGRGRARRRRRGDAGRPRQARRLLARVRQPLPRRARARRRDHPGARPPHRPRSRGARRAMSTDRSRPLRETSYGGVVLRGDDVLVITPTGKRRVTGLPKGGADPGETPRADRGARGARGDRRHGDACASRSAT